MNVTDLPKLIEDLKTRHDEQASLRAMLTEVSQAFSEVLERLESAGPEQSAAIAKAVADALKDLRIQPNMQAPSVQVAAPTVNVAAPNVNVEPPAVHVAAPQVSVNPQITMPSAAGRDCDIEIMYGAGGMATGFKVRYRPGK